MDHQANATAAQVVSLDMPKSGLSFEESLALIILIVIAVFLQWIPLSSSTFLQSRNHKKIKKILREKNENVVLSKYLLFHLYMIYTIKKEEYLQST